MKYVEFKKNENVYVKGDEANQFYVILNGSVDQKVVNPVIDEWDWAYGNYMALIEWKKNFDLRAI